MFNRNILSSISIHAPNLTCYTEGGASVILQLQPGLPVRPVSYVVWDFSSQATSQLLFLGEKGGRTERKPQGEKGGRTEIWWNLRDFKPNQIGLMTASVLGLLCRKTSPGNLTLGLSEQNIVCHGIDKGFEILQGITLASERQDVKFFSLLIGAAKYLRYLKAV